MTFAWSVCSSSQCERCDWLPMFTVLWLRHVCCGCRMFTVMWRPHVYSAVAALCLQCCGVRMFTVLWLPLVCLFFTMLCARLAVWLARCDSKELVFLRTYIM